MDIEAVLPSPEADEIAALCFSASEYESYTALGPEHRLEGFLQRWSRLEALCKALGCGLGPRRSCKMAEYRIPKACLSTSEIYRDLPRRLKQRRDLPSR
ncbi:4'-phosphopantetheinyl transferase superfamily protein [Bradyrhizobium diazoefficiens]|uniref:4'-phosphopantetheinyl transferase superfamily protein n=1 Tax=Bradyrhizobium diazoefficiens TaxID=1355477 RepID=UPI001FEEF45F|nr:4'-phosphopantetheinyl transferase superfamily protein [Bradyrhizobium diazoefficiens]